MTVMILPKYLHKYFRTSNQIGRLNKELKHRSKVIGIFSNNESLMRLMGAVLVERNKILSSGRRPFKTQTYQNLIDTDVSVDLVKVAQE